MHLFLRHLIYNNNKDEFLKVRASHILISNTDDEGNTVSDEQKAKNKEEAEKILKQAQQGVDFAQLAKFSSRLSNILLCFSYPK